jgi:hypothetical protein
MAHHKHSHPEGEVCEHTPIDIDADLEHDHRLHNHNHHNLHQHVSNEISTASSLSAANQKYFNNNNNNKNLSCVPCAYSNDLPQTASLIVQDSKGDLNDHDAQTPVSVDIVDPEEKSENKTSNPIIQQLKSK